MFCKIKQVLEYIIKKIKQDRVSAFAAQSSFFILLSLFPLLMLIISLISRINIDFVAFFSENDGQLPAAVTGFFDLVLSDMRSSGNTAVFSSVTAVTLLWSASKGIYALCEGLGITVGDKERSYLRARGLSLLYTLFMIIAVIAMTVLPMLGRKLVEDLYDRTSALFTITAWCIGFVLMSLFITSIYCFLPGGKRSFLTELRGGVICAAAWTLFSYGFSFYTTSFADYSAIYGSIAVVAVFMIWLYACMYMLFIGAIINGMFAKNANVKSIDC